MRCRKARHAFQAGNDVGQLLVPAVSVEGGHSAVTLSDGLCAKVAIRARSLVLMPSTVSAERINWLIKSSIMRGRRGSAEVL